METWSTRNAGVRMAFWPDARENNPYQSLFHNALLAYGIRYDTRFDLSDEWLRERSDDFDGLHFHWPEAAWRWRGSTLYARLLGVSGLLRFIKVARSHGLRIVWTVHNLKHHDGADWVDILGYRVLASNADLMICHSDNAKRSIRRWIGRSCPVVVMRHGTYTGQYPVPADRDDTLRKLGLDPSIPTVCQLGLLRNYKGAETAAAASARLTGRVQFVIAGTAGKNYDPTRLRKLVRGSANCLLLEQYLSEQQFADIANASDAFLLPYRRITGSGVALAALTFDKGIIASDLPYFRVLLQEDPDAGRLFPVDNVSGCARAVEDFLSIPTQSRESACRSIARKHKWEDCVKELVPKMSALFPTLVNSKS